MKLREFTIEDFRAFGGAEVDIEGNKPMIGEEHNCLVIVDQRGLTIFSEICEKGPTGKLRTIEQRIECARHTALKIAMVLDEDDLIDFMATEAITH